MDELRRLAKSSGGLTYEDAVRVRSMDRAQLVLVLAKLYELDGLTLLDSTSPEEFARAIVDRARPKAPEGAAQELLLTLVAGVFPGY
jgi:hypothetical protein